MKGHSIRKVGNHCYYVDPGRSSGLAVKASISPPAKRSQRGQIRRGRQEMEVAGLAAWGIEFYSGSCYVAEDECPRG